MVSIVLVVVSMVLLGWQRLEAATPDAPRYTKFIMEGDRKAASGDQAGAYDEYVQARNADPKRPGAYARLAITALELKRRSEGLDAIKTLIELDPRAVDDKDILIIQRSLIMLPGQVVAATNLQPRAPRDSAEAKETKPSGSLIELKSAEKAIRDAAAAWHTGDLSQARQFGLEAFFALAPVLRSDGSLGIDAWTALGRVALILNSPRIAAVSLSMIEILRPGAAADVGQVSFLADLNRLSGTALLEDARRNPTSFAQSSLGQPILGVPYMNSLGMRFTPTTNSSVLFSIWETRVRDFEMFVSETGHDATAYMNSYGANGWKAQGDTWKSPGFHQTGIHPVVGVNWTDGKAFCDWLSKKEGLKYRLPTDLEWSSAVGLPAEKGETPRARENGWPSLDRPFPWGFEFPPPPNSGNYGGSEARDGQWPTWAKTIDGYRDRFPATAPVGSFVANSFGLFDMGGNVSEWCEDRYDLDSNDRTFRGGSWRSTAKEILTSCMRLHAPSALRSADLGFRVVLEVNSTRSSAP